MQKFIVDGYNVIYTDDRLRRIACRDNQRARDQFLTLVREYVAERNVQLTVVFDGRGGLVDSDVIVPGRLQVMYSAGGETADEVIVRMLEEAANPRGYIVVTSDMSDIGGRARGLGCEVLRSKPFLRRLRPEVGAAREEGDVAEDDTSYWLNRFEEGADDGQKD